MERLAEHLSRRAPGEWELYEKRAESRELTASAASRGERWRREEGYAARWWEKGGPRFAAGPNEAALEAAIAEAARIPAAPAEPPDWPDGGARMEDALHAVESPPDLFTELARLVSAESRGGVFLTELTLRRGAALERIRNARGLDVSNLSTRLDGFASAVGRRETRACESRVLFRWNAEPELPALARRLSDRATLPLSERGVPFSRGEWLLESSVSSALLAAVAPLFVSETPPKWLSRGELFSPVVTIVDDASADASYDGEGTPTRRVLVVEKGAWRYRLHDLRSAKRAGERPTGHGVRTSYRTPPAPLSRRLFFETERGASPEELLASVRRGLYASALTAPLRMNFEADRYEAEFTGIAIVAGRAQGPVAGTRASGRLSELLRRISGVSTDRQFFPLPYPVGAPTLFVDRAAFD